MSSLIILIALLAAVSIFLIVYSLSSSFRPHSNLLEERLAQFNESGKVIHNLTEVELTLPFFERVLRPAFDKFAQRLASRTPTASQHALQDQLNLAGKPWGLTVGGFLVLRIGSFIVFLFL